MINKDKLIYVDAGDSNNHLSFKKPFKISLIDEDNNIENTSILNLFKITNMEAEYYAILNAIKYVLKNEFNKNYNVIIHSDNKNIVNYQNVQNYCNTKNIKLKWISRELNSKADLLSKSLENHLILNNQLNELIDLKQIIN